jgi:heterodisulfide reductase subunit A
MKKRIGVYVCECGPNIAGAVDIDRVLEAVSSLDGVAVAEKYGLLCSGDGKKYLVEQLKEHELTHLVVGACSPKQHEPTFMTVCKEGGINPFLFQMANIREQVAWITPDKEKATERTIRHLRAAIRRVQYHTALKRKEIKSNPDVLVIGGGMAGISTALLLGNSRRVYIVDNGDALGGKALNYEKISPAMVDSNDTVKEYLGGIEANENIEVLTNTSVEEVIGFFGNFIVTVRENDAESGTRELKVGAIVVAIGMDPLNPEVMSEYGYGKIRNVYTSSELEQANMDGVIGLSGGGKPKSAGIIHCIGRKEAGYCSEVCCAVGMKIAGCLQEKFPGIAVTEFYQDLSIPGREAQTLYDETKRAGTEFIRAANVRLSESAGKIKISHEREGDKVEQEAVDMVVLLLGIGPPADAEKISNMLGVPLGNRGFFAEEHAKTSPVSSSMEGIYLAGCASGPKGISDTISQSEAVAGKILAGLVPGRKIETEAKTSRIAENLCVGCQTCLTVCCYGAISYDETRGICVVNEVLCKGCGNCAAACPSGAANHQHFTSRQVYQEIAEIVK